VNALLALLWLIAHPALGFAGDEPCAAFSLDADYDDERPASVLSLGVCFGWGETPDDTSGSFARARSAMP